MNEGLGTMIFIGLAVLFIVGLMIGGWRRLRKSEEMLKDVDRSKLKNYDKDGWDD